MHRGECVAAVCSRQVRAERQPFAVKRRYRPGANDAQGRVGNADRLRSISDRRADRTARRVSTSRATSICSISAACSLPSESRMIRATSVSMRLVYPRNSRGGRRFESAAAPTMARSAGEAYVESALDAPIWARNAMASAIVGTAEPTAIGRRVCQRLGRRAPFFERSFQDALEFIHLAAEAGARLAPSAAM